MNKSALDPRKSAADPSVLFEDTCGNLINGFSP
jgi:hypothetical protein